MRIFLELIFWLSIAFVFYTYVGYPILIAWLAHLRVRPAVSSTHLPFITLLITAYNEEAVIEKKIQNSLELDYPAERLQIIVAADGSTDKTADLVRKFQVQGVTLAFTPQRDGKIAAINRAVLLATGQVIVFSDANNMYDKDALRKLAAPFGDVRVGATTGAKLIIQDGGSLSGAEGVYWRYESWIKGNETTLGTCTSAVGEILAVRREYFIPPPGNIINDDYYIVLDLIRRGYSVVYVPGAKSYEYASGTVQDEMTRRSRMNAGKYQAMSLSWHMLPMRRPLVVWQIVSHKFCRAFLPFGFIAAFLSNVLLVIYSLLVQEGFGLYQVLFVLQAIFYAFAYIGNTVQFRGMLGKLFYLPAYLVNSNGAILRGFYGYASKRQTNIWERVRRDRV